MQKDKGLIKAFFSKDFMDNLKFKCTNPTKNCAECSKFNQCGLEPHMVKLWQKIEQEEKKKKGESKNE